MRPLLALAFVGLVLGALDVRLVDAAKTKKLKNSLLSVAEPNPGKPKRPLSPPDQLMIIWKHSRPGWQRPATCRCFAPGPGESCRTGPSGPR